MNSNHTDITIVLDRSGSMVSVAGDTIGGFNRFLEDQKKAHGTATITLRQFDTEHDVVIDAKNIHEAKPLDNTTFVPRGSTALLDAIGIGVDATGKRLGDLPEPQRPGKVVFVIITDGQENASVRFNHKQIDEKIRLQRDTYKWEFVFLGANQDAIATASRIGVSINNAMTYAATGAGTSNAFKATSANLCSLRSAAASTMAYNSDQRDEQEKLIKLAGK